MEICLIWGGEKRLKVAESAKMESEGMLCGTTSDWAGTQTFILF
jgi:hypothetical protein